MTKKREIGTVARWDGKKWNRLTTLALVDVLDSMLVEIKINQHSILVYFDEKANVTKATVHGPT